MRLHKKMAPAEAETISKLNILLFFHCLLDRGHLIIRKLGLFGSYAKQTANGKSDIDIAIIYKKSAIKDEKALAELVCFFQEIIAHFRKNIDFVDYNAAKHKEDCKEFIKTINSYMKWV